MNVNRPAQPIIALDIGGVIIPALDEIIDSYIQQTIGMTDEMFQKVWPQYTPLLVTGKISEEMFWRHIERELGRPIQSQSDLFMEKYRLHLTVNQSLLEDLTRLKEKFEFAVMSNSIKPYSEYNEQLGIYDQFDHIFLSDEIGAMKPDAAFYNHVVTALGVPAHRIFFFDDKQENIEAARVVGLQAYRYISNDALLCQLQLSTLPD